MRDSVTVEQQGTLLPRIHTNTAADQLCQYTMNIRYVIQDI